MGVPLVQFSADALAHAGVREVVANIHHLPDVAIAGLESLEWHGMHTRWSDERGLLLGSSGGIAKASKLLGDAPFFIANADVLADLDWTQLARRHALLRRQWGVTLTLTIFERATVDGTYTEVVVDPSSGLIRGLGPREVGRPLYVGAAVIEPEAIAHLDPAQPSEFVPQVLEPAIRAGKAGAYFTRGLWLDIGSPELWARSHFLMMDALERGRLIGPSSKLWRERLERLNRRAGSGIWISRRSGAQPRADWVGPVYVDGIASRAPLGPGAILYREQPTDFRTGIAFRGQLDLLSPSARI